MQSKTFLTILFSMSTIIILLGIYFIGSYITLQDKKNQESALQRFDNSTLVHKFLFDNITELRVDWKNKLAPLLDQIPNATQSRIDQQLHYNQTTQDFETIKRILEIKLQDHETLIGLNATVNEIYNILTNGTAAAKPIPVPAPIDNNTGDGGIIIENITGNNSTILR